MTRYEYLQALKAARNEVARSRGAVRLIQGKVDAQIAAALKVIDDADSKLTALMAVDTSKLTD